MEADYRNQTDEELLGRIADGETEIIEYLMDKYKNLVKNKAMSMFILGADRDDLNQEGMIGLFKAIRDYDSGRDASFYTFADLCISRQMYTALQASKRQKHIPLNSYISLYSSMTQKEDGEEMELVNVLSAADDMTPEDMIIDQENVESLERTIERELSSFEKQVLDLYLTGMTYTQIAKVLGKGEKATDNALQRLKAKIRKAIDKPRTV